MVAKTIALDEVTTKITPFERELLTMFPNVRFGNVMWELKENGLCAYMPRKTSITFTHDLPRLSHEIAHMVEMNNFNRLVVDDWGMPLTADFASNMRFKDAGFCLRATARECRVKAIESFLCKSQYPLKRVLHNNWYQHVLHPKVHNGSSFGRFKSTKDIDDWMRSIFESTQNKWSLERIRHEWMRRVEYIRNWQESNG